MEDKNKKFAGDILLIAIWGVFLVGIIIMASSVPAEDFTITKVEEEYTGNGQHILNTTCYVATGNLTYSETVPQPNHTVAIRFTSQIVQTMELEMGDQVYIQDYGTYVVEDRIPDYQSADLDLFYGEDLGGCLLFGRRNLIVEKL